MRIQNKVKSMVERKKKKAQLLGSAFKGVSTVLGNGQAVNKLETHTCNLPLQRLQFSGRQTHTVTKRIHSV